MLVYVSVAELFTCYVSTVFVICSFRRNASLVPCSVRLSLEWRMFFRRGRVERSSFTTRMFFTMSLLGCKACNHLLHHCCNDNILIPGVRIFSLPDCFLQVYRCPISRKTSSRCELYAHSSASYIGLILRFGD